MTMEQTTEQGTTQSIPIINARKTLLIGIGSTGAKVCNQILERILWTYNSPDNIPWLRSIVLETAKVDAERMVNKHAKFIHLKINRTDYSNLIANPRNYEQTMDFSSWNIPELTGTTDVIEDGANNTRILGRLSLLFPSNIIEIQRVITNELATLSALKTTDVSNRFSMAIGEPTQVDLPDEIFVYVVGTLCGGTASGAFIDLGYLLQSLPGQHLNSTGIFMLPSAEEQNALLVANAYAALIELNHYSDDRIRYKTQFACGVPGVPFEPPTPGVRPYKNLYLVQSRGAAAIEYAKLLSSTADYIYSDVIGSTALTRDAKRTNISQFFTQRDSWGASQKYFTFGLSSIEFPFAKVIKACSLRLSLRGYEDLAGGEQMTELARNTIVNQCPLLNRETMIQSLQTYLSVPLNKTIQEVVSASVTDCVRSDDALLLIRDQLDAAFKGGSRNPHQKLQNGIIPQVIEDNSRRLINEFRRDLTDTIRTMLCGSTPIGLQTVLSGLDALELALKSLKGTDRLRSELDTSANLTELMERITECRNDFWLGLVMQKGAAVRNYVQQFLEFAISSYQQRVRSLCTPYCVKFADEGLKIITASRRRIKDSEHPEAGLLGEVNKLVAGFKNFYDRTDVTSGTSTDGWSRTVNGTELFTPGQTVDEEYWKCLREVSIDQQVGAIDNQEIENYFARASVRGFLSSAADDILADPTQRNKFDYDQYKALREYDDTQLLMKTTPAQEIFRSLRNRTIIDRLLERVDARIKLQDASNESKRFLDWTEGHPRYYPHQNKNYGFTFYNDNDPRAMEFRNRLNEVDLLNITEAQTFTDRNQILILRENGAFSLGSVGQLKDEVSSFWRSSYKNPPGNIHSLHSRGDIEEWISWERSDEEARVSIRNVFLTAVALNIIEFNSVTDYRFSYDRRSPADPGFIQFTNDLDKAAFAIKRKNLESMITLRINQLRNDTSNGAEKMVKTIDEFIRSSNNKFSESVRTLTMIDIEAYMLEYILRDTELEEIYNKLYDNPVIKSYRRPDSEGRIGYYCPNCTTLLGYSVDSLFMYDERDGGRQRVRRCAFCKKDI